LGQLDSPGEVLTVGEQHTAAQASVPLEIAQRLAQLGVHLQVEGIALGRAVEPHEADGPAPLETDAPERHPRTSSASGRRPT